MRALRRLAVGAFMTLVLLDVTLALVFPGDPGTGARFWLSKILCFATVVGFAGISLSLLHDPSRHLPAGIAVAGQPQGERYLAVRVVALLMLAAAIYIGSKCLR